jgi:uncharacterized protein YcbX
MIDMTSGSFPAVGTVARLWRYPVKSMRGEQLATAVVDARGLVGDRRFAVWDAEDKFGSCKNSRRFRRMDGLLDFRSEFGDEPAEASQAADAAAYDPRLVAPDGARHRIPSAAADAAVRAYLGRADVRVMVEAEVPHHDAAPLHLVSTATLDWYVRALGGVPADERRLRPNLVVDLPGAAAFAEDGWAGRRVRIGEGADAVLARWVKQTERCRTLNVAQEELPYTSQGLKVLGGRDLNLGVYLEVVAGGRVRVGDPVTLLD